MNIIIKWGLDFIYIFYNTIYILYYIMLIIILYIYTILVFRFRFECLGETFNKQASFIKGIKFQKDFHKTLLC